jgi:hypothetical protein
MKLSKLLLMIATFLLALLLVASCGCTPPTMTSLTTTTSITTSITTPALNQSQTSIPGSTGLEGDRWLSQGFVPSMPLLNTVEVYIESVYADLSNPLSLQVRSDDNGLPSNSVLASTGITIPAAAWGWITFDIPDIEVIPGIRYHIVLFSTLNYHIGSDLTNPYPDGYMGYSTDAGKTWRMLNDNPNYDMAFKILGSALSEPVSITLKSDQQPSGGGICGGNSNAQASGSADSVYILGIVFLSLILVRFRLK